MRRATIKGAYALAGTQACAINTYQYHVGKDATSNLSLHGIASQQALADYRGMIRIEQKASGTSATQENKTILLGDRAPALQSRVLKYSIMTFLVLMGVPSGHLIAHIFCMHNHAV